MKLIFKKGVNAAMSSKKENARAQTDVNKGAGVMPSA